MNFDFDRTHCCNFGVKCKLCGGGVYYTQLCVLFFVKFPKFAQNFNPLFNRLILNIGIAKVLKLLPVDLKWIFCEYLYEAKKGDGFFIKYHGESEK